MEGRAGRGAVVADEADGLARRDRDTVLDHWLFVRHVAVRPFATVDGRAHGQADAAASVRHVPRIDDETVGERIERRAFRRRDVGRGIVVVVMAYRDNRGPAADRKDVVALVD